MDKEPVVISGLLIAFIQAAIVMAQQMEWIQLSEQQFAAVMAFVAAAIALGSFVVRQYVTPLSNPKDSDGASLIRSDGGQPLKKRGF